MEDTYLLYLPATQSEHVALDALSLIIHTESRYKQTYNRVIEALQTEMDSVIYIYQA